MENKAFYSAIMFNNLLVIATFVYNYNLIELIEFDGAFKGFA